MERQTETAAAGTPGAEPAGRKIERAKEIIEEKYSAASETLKSKYGDVKGKVGDKYDDVKEKVSEKYGEVKKKVDEIDFNELTEQGRAYVRSNPGKALLISVAVGFVVGLLLRRRDDD